MALWWSSMDANNWDLQAVVRLGCCSFSTPTTTTTNSAAAVKEPFSFFQSSATADHQHHHHHHDFVEDQINPLPDSIATRNVIHELEELCKPFFSLPPPPPPPPLPPPEGPHRPQLVRQQPPRKKGKRQQKKVVCQVPADGLPSDMWAWRKYGQKPIKGSPYPRGYYRCSSSKGCSARKQVERSRTDPSMLIITYTGDHNHAVPKHRNSLAGSTRNKFPQSSGSNEEKTEGSSPRSTMSAVRSIVGSTEEENEGDEDEGGTGSIGEMMGDLEEDMGLLDSEGFDDEGSDEFVKRFFSESWEVDHNYSKATGDGGS